MYRVVWVEEVDPKPEPTFTLDQVIDKMIEIFGENIVNPEMYPKIFKYQFDLAKYQCSLSSSEDSNNLSAGCSTQS